MCERCKNHDWVSAYEEAATVLCRVLVDSRDWLPVDQLAMVERAVVRVKNLKSVRDQKNIVDNPHQRY